MLEAYLKFVSFLARLSAIVYPFVLIKIYVMSKRASCPGILSCSEKQFGKKEFVQTIRLPYRTKSFSGFEELLKDERVVCTNVAGKWVSSLLSQVALKLVE